MTPDQFIAALAPWANWCSPQTGVDRSVILAQWALETGWGSSVAWLEGHNPAGISGGGHPLSYSSVQEGMNAYVETMRLEYYNGVRQARPQGAIAQAKALGISPWDAGHYGGAANPGSTLVAIIEQHNLQRFDAPENHPPIVTPGKATTWDVMVPSQWKFLEACWALSDAWYSIVQRHPNTPAEWHLIGSLAVEISEGKSTLGGAIVEISQNVAGATKLKLA
jgi:hypothetical protein